MLTQMTFDERYRAIDARDARFDGQFVTAVRSTGIYCRPSCPARTPKPANVTFYPTSAAAHEAGYRACKRCLPEAAPGSPLWNVRGDAASRAMRLIADGSVERGGVPGLAGALGYSPRHLTRLLRAEVGAGPLALARAHRAQTSRTLLIETDLPVADVAFSAGFSSVRQFNDTIRDVFGVTPTELRARRRARTPGERAGTPDDAGGRALPISGATDGTAAMIRLALPVRRPFDAAGVFAWLRARVVDGAEEAGEARFARTVRLPGGVAWFEVSHAGVPALGDTDRIALTAHLQNLSDLGTLIARVRRLFDLDADPVAVDAALSAHPEIAPLVARIPGIRVPGTADPHEMLIRAMVGQQISVPAARTHLTRLAEALGERAEIAGAERLLFPTAAAIAEGGRDVLRGPASRVNAILGAAEALASGDLALTGADDGARQRADLLAMRGIGPWTADYVRMRVLNDPDVLLPGDLVLRNGAAAAGLPAEPKPLAAWAERASPWRSYLSAHLWRAALPAGGAPRTAPMPDAVPRDAPSRAKETP